MAERTSRLADKAREMGAKDMTSEAPRRLSDKRNDGVTPSVGLEGFVDQDITVKDFELLDSQFGEGEKYVIITADTPMGSDVRIRTGSVVVMRKLDENKEYMPYVVTVKKAGRALNIE